jgi:hypothetical protein
MQLHFDPAWRLLDRRTRVVGAPALDETHLEHAETPQVVDANTCRRRQTCKNWADSIINLIGRIPYCSRIIWHFCWP